MDRDNCSSLTEFIFLGISENTENKVTLFTVFLLVYPISLLENLGIITLTRMDPQLHTPMYFFLSHLSFCDLCYSTAIGPKMLVETIVFEYLPVTIPEEAAYIRKRVLNRTIKRGNEKYLFSED